MIKEYKKLAELQLRTKYEFYIQQTQLKNAPKGFRALDLFYIKTENEYYVAGDIEWGIELQIQEQRNTLKESQKKACELDEEIKKETIIISNLKNNKKILKHKLYNDAKLSDQLIYRFFKQYNNVNINEITNVFGDYIVNKHLCE